MNNNGFDPDFLRNWIAELGVRNTWHILLDLPGEPRSGTVLRVVTDYGCKTVEGVLPLMQEAMRLYLFFGEDRRVFEYAGDDLNIGDVLSHKLDLSPYLKEVGILELSVLEEPLLPKNWVHDTRLITPPERCLDESPFLDVDMSTIKIAPVGFNGYEISFEFDTLIYEISFDQEMSHFSCPCRVVSIEDRGSVYTMVLWAGSREEAISIATDLMNL